MIFCLGSFCFEKNRNVPGFDIYHNKIPVHFNTTENLNIPLRHPPVAIGDEFTNLPIRWLDQTCYFAQPDHLHVFFGGCSRGTSSQCAAPRFGRDDPGKRRSEAAPAWGDGRAPTASVFIAAAPRRSRAQSGAVISHRGCGGR